MTGNFDNAAGRKRIPLPYGLAVLAILAFAMFLRVYPLPQESFDGDELFTRKVVVAPLPQAWEEIRQDLVHPPLYYVLVKASLFGKEDPDEYDLRLLSLASAAVTALALIAAGYLLPPFRSAAVLAATLLAINKLHVFYSQQARSYSLYCLLVALMILWRAGEARWGRRPVFWLAAILLMTAALWTHYVAVFYCFALVISVILRPVCRPSRAGWWRPVLALAAPLLLLLPWILSEIPVYQAKQGLAVNLGWQGLPDFYLLRLTFAEYIGVPDLPGGTTAALLLGLLLAACAWLPERRGPNPEDGPFRFTLAAMAALPPIFLWLASRWPFELPVFGARHVLPSILPALLLVSLGAVRLASLARGQLARGLLLAGISILLCALQVLVLWPRWPGPARTPQRQIAAALLALDPPAPVYDTYAYGIGELVRYYLRGAGPAVQEIQPGELPGLPGRFVLLYRPAVPSERRLAEQVMRARNVEFAQYFSGTISPRFGVRMVILSQME